DDLVSRLEVPGSIDAVEIGSRFAVRAQSMWLGWPAALEEELLEWIGDNHAATRSRDRTRTAAVAQRFDEIIRSLTDSRHEASAPAPDDVTTRLVRDPADSRPLTDDEIGAILRTWTGRDLGSIALSTGVILNCLATHSHVQDWLRSGGSSREFDAILDEI